jgi:UDP-N-acetylglucosamine acyltransferase
LATIHPTSIVSPDARIASDVYIGPFCYIEDGVDIGAGTHLDSHVTVKSGTTIGARNYIAQGAILGGLPQDRNFKDAPTELIIGDDNVIREYVTIHRAKIDHAATKIANRCFIMAYVHLGHDCVVEDDVTITNNVGCSGHVTIERGANIGGMAGVHQWTRIGQAAMVAGMARITRDVPPFCIVEGDNHVLDINAVGLRRAGVTPDARKALHRAVKLLFKSQLGLTHAIEIVRAEVPMTPEVEQMLKFEERRFGGRNGRGDQR